jgi:hypothetical protein
MIVTNWSDDTGRCASHSETRSEGQEEDVQIPSWPSEWSTAQMHLEEIQSHYDQSWGRMIYEAHKDDCEVVLQY